MSNISLVPTNTPPGLSNAQSNSNIVQSTPNFNDELANLYPMALSNNSSDAALMFPVLIFKESLSKDLAIHKYVSRNGAKIENMGSNPEVWQIRAIFTNNIDPSPLPSTYRGNLFPQQFIKVLDLLKTPGTKIMQHPLYGNVSVQVQSYEYDLISTGPRDGSILTINLIQSYPDNAVAPIAALSTSAAAKRVNTALQQGDILGIPGPGGLSISQFFGQMASNIQDVLQFPQRAVDAVSDQTLQFTALTNISSSLNNNLSFNLTAVVNPVNVSGSVSATLVAGSNLFTAGAGAGIGTNNNSANTIAYYQNGANTTIYSNKPAPLGSPLSPYPSSNNTFVNGSVSSIAQSFTLGGVSLKASNSLLSLNNNPSKNANDFLNKCIRATYDTMQYYITLNINQTSYIISTLGQMLYSLQQAQIVLQSQNNNSNVVINTYITKGNISWPQLSTMLNNKLSDLFGLNKIANSNYLYVPQNTVVKYYQAN